MYESPLRSALHKLGATTAALAMVAAFSGVAMAQESTVPESSAPPSSAKQAVAAGPDLKITAAFDKASYDILDTVQVKVTIANIGTEPASRAIVVPSGFNSDGLTYSTEQWGGLLSSKGGVDIAAGAEHVVTLAGTVKNVSKGEALLKAVVEAPADVDTSNNVLDTKVAVTHRTGSASGTFYGDRNLNGKQDADEALAGVGVRVEGGTPHKWATGTTDAAGKVSFADLPVGDYTVSITYLDGWVYETDLAQPKWVVEAGKDSANPVRAVRPLSDKLHASMEFTDKTYAPDDTVHLKITVTNDSEAALTVYALCAGYGHPFEIGNSGDGWGPFKYGGTGLPLAAGETKTVEVTDSVPEPSYNHGLVLAACAFGPKPEPGNGSPYAQATAKVPGAVGNAAGRLFKITEGTSLPGLKIVLLDLDTEAPVARTVSDDNGNFRFEGLPAGHYQPVVVGPWKVVSHRSGPLFAVVKDSDYPQDITVEPGPDVADPDLTTPPTETTEPTTPPDGSGGAVPPTTSGLASTGASVIGITQLGLLLLALGIGTTIIGRRRRA